MALSQAPPLTCSVSVSDLSPGPDWVSLKVVTPGRNCSFTLVSLDGGEGGGECRRGGAEVGGDPRGGGGVFLCLMDHLEPGTSYQLQLRSQGHQVLNVTVATSKCPPPSRRQVEPVLRGPSSEAPLNPNPNPAGVLQRAPGEGSWGRFLGP